jgi:hypothetical protein
VQIAERDSGVIEFQSGNAAAAAAVVLVFNNQVGRHGKTRRHNITQLLPDYVLDAHSCMLDHASHQ